MEDIDCKITDPEVEAMDAKNASPPDFVVVDRLDELHEHQVDLKKSFQNATKTMTSLENRYKTLALEVEDARRKWDIFRGYSMLTLPVVFAYIFEAMMTTSSTTLALRQDTRTVLVIFRGLCLVFSLCVGLPFLLEELLSYNCYLARKDVITRRLIVDDDDDDDIIDDSDVSASESDNAVGDGNVDTLET